MRVIVALAALALVIGCAKKDDPVPATPSASPSAAGKQAQAGGGAVAGTPYVPGAGAVSPVQGGDFGGGGGGVQQAALGRARKVAGGESNTTHGAESGGD